jgi:hypothetical protein
VYYLAPLLDDGPTIRGRVSRVPAGYEQSRGRICLADQALLWCPDGLTDSRAVKLADGLAEKPAAATVKALSSVLDLPAQASTVTDVLAGHFRPTLTPGLFFEGGRWVSRLEIWLGERIWAEDVPLARHSQYLADTFDGATGSINGRVLSTSTSGSAAWTQVVSGGSGWTGASNQARRLNISPDTFAMLVADQDGDTDNLVAEIDFAGFTRTSGGDVEMDVSTNNNAGGTTGYLAVINQVSSGGWKYSIVRLSDFTAIATLDPASAFASGLINLTNNGRALSLTLAGSVVLGPTTDTVETIGSGHRHVGISAYADVTSGNGVAVNGFTVGGDLGATPPSGGSFVSAWARGSNTIL